MARLPDFISEDDIFEFFESHSGTDFLDDAEEIKGPVLDRRSPQKEVTTLRLDPALKRVLKLIARNKGIRYQTLISMWLTEKAKEEIRRTGQAK
ncbi:MAG: CopG family antitoxin [Candidatus Eremiobacteraeota bacterium]|nr:CopG family antitoxin [Candidatus Eremiobacteraeota bacterium]